MPRKLKTIYEQFDSYSKDEVNAVIEKLCDFDKKVIACRYGNDLENPQISENWNTTLGREFYGVVIPKIKRLLEGKQQRRRSVEKSISSLLNNDSNHPDDIDFTSGSKKKETESVETQTAKNVNGGSVSEVLDTETQGMVKANDIADGMSMEVDPNKDASTLTRNDYLKILRLLKTPSMFDLLQTMSPKEVVVIILRLGYINDVYYSEEKIASFLEIEVEEVREITKNVLTMQRNKFNSFLDEAIDSVSYKEKVLLPKNKVIK